MVVNLTGYGVGIQGNMYFLTELFSLDGLQVVLGTFAFLFSVRSGSWSNRLGGRDVYFEVCEGTTIDSVFEGMILGVMVR